VTVAPIKPHIYSHARFTRTEPSLRNPFAAPSAVPTCQPRFMDEHLAARVPLHPVERRLASTRMNRVSIGKRNSRDARNEADLYEAILRASLHDRNKTAVVVIPRVNYVDTSSRLVAAPLSSSKREIREFEVLFLPSGEES